MHDLGLLIMRLTVGGLLSGHGAQKLFGWFGGYGLQGTGGWMESVGLRPGHWWAALAGLGEFGGGVLTALGLFHPIGPIMTLGPMAVATGTVHAGKPIWATEGGAELPVTNMSVAVGLALAGPGRFSVDRMLGIKVPRFLVALAVMGVALSVAITLTSRAAAEKQEAKVPAGEEEAATEVAGAEFQAGGSAVRSEAM